MLTDSSSTPFSTISEGNRIKERHHALDCLGKSELQHVMGLEKLVQTAKRMTNLRRGDPSEIIVHSPDHHLVLLRYRAPFIAEGMDAPSVSRLKSLWTPCLTFQTKGQDQTVFPLLQPKQIRPH